jgi:hypothetical protein
MSTDLKMLCFIWDGFSTVAAASAALFPPFFALFVLIPNVLETCG